MKTKVIKIIIVIILIAIAMTSGYFLGVQKNKTDDVKTSKKFYTYIICESMESEREDLESVKMVYTFDKNDVCIDCRMVWNFDTEEIAKENYENWVKTEQKNLKIENTTVSFNAEYEIGKTKEEVRKFETQNFEVYEY